MSKLADARTETGAHTIVGVFDHLEDARTAMRRLEAAGMPADRIGIVSGNVREAREPVGSFSPQGALVGGLAGFVLTLGYVVVGGESVRQNPAAILLGGFILVVGLAFIGWLAGRGRLFKHGEYEELEDDVALGETLVSVVCDTPDGADQTRALLERSGSREIRLEGSGQRI